MILLLVTLTLTIISLMMLTEVLSMFKEWERKTKNPCSPLCSVTSNNHLPYKLIISITGMIITLVLFFIVTDILIFLTSGVFLLDLTWHMGLLLSSMGTHLIVSIVHILYRRDLMIYDIKQKEA